MDSGKNNVGMNAHNSTVAAAGMGHLVQNGARKDLHLKMTSADAEAVQVTSADTVADDTVPLSPGGSSEATSDSQPLSPTADAGRNVAVDYMKTKYGGGEKVKKDQVIVPKVIREPRKLDFQWDKVVDEKLKRNDASGPVIREQDLIGLMLTCAGLDSGKSQYLSIVETADKEPTPVNREPIEKVAPPEITKKVRNMFETGKLTDLHESSKTEDETYEVLPGSGVFENVPVRIEGVVRESDLNEEGEGVQRGTTKSLLDHWKTKMTGDDNVKVSPNRPVFVTEAEGKVVESTPIHRDDVVREEDLDWDAAHIEKGLTKSLLSQWSTIGSTEFKSPKKRINVADAEGKVLESKPIRRNDVIREDDVTAESELVQKGTTRGLLSQWSVKGTEETRTERKPIRIAEGEGRVSENEPIKRKDVVREEDVSLEGEQVEKGFTKSLLSQWKSKDKEVFSVEKRVINVAEDDGRVVESQPIRRDDVVRASDNDDIEAVQKGTTKSLLAQWKTKGTDAYKPGLKRPINIADAEGKVLENEPIQRSDVVREGDIALEGEQVQKGTTRTLLNQWQNKREEFKKDKTPIVVAEAEGTVAENVPTRRDDVVRENDVEAEGERIQRGTTKALLSQWQNKRDDFRKDKTPIILDEAEGTIAENDPIKRTDVVREEDFHAEGEVVQRGTTKSLLSQWKFKGSQEFVAERKPIDIAEGEGKVSENEPVQRSDVVHEYDNNVEDEEVQKGILKSLREQWKKKESEEFKIAKRNIVINEDEGRVVENEPQIRDDVVRENELDAEVQVERGFTKSLLGQWKNKGSEEFKLPKREIVIAEDDGTVAENQPSPRNDVFRENDNNIEMMQVQKGITRNLLGQWKTKGSQEFQATRKEIILAEDEGTVSENNPEQRSDIVREGDFNGDGEKIQKGYTKSLLGQWKNKGNEEFKGPKKEIVLAEDEGKISENQPLQRNDVVREYDASLEDEKIQKGYTKALLGQWKNKGNEEFKAPRREIILAGDEGKIAENEPVQRNDVSREFDANTEEEKIQKGYTKNLLGQWKNKGNQEFKAPKREIVLAEDDGRIAENEPVQRSDVFREYDANIEGETIQKGYTKNLLGQWKNKGNEEFKAQRKEIILAEDQGVVAENEPVQRSDVTREYEADLEGDKIQKGYTKNLLGQWKNKGNEEFKAQKREIILAEDEGVVSENQPVQRSDVTREYEADNEGDKIQKGYTKNLLGQWKNKGNEEFKAQKREIILAEDEGVVAENEPVQRSDVTREYEADNEGDKIQKGYTKNLLGQWKNKGNEEFKAQKREIILAEDEGVVAENQPVQRSDVTREYEADNEGDKIQKGYTKNLLGQWKNKGNEEFKAQKREIILAEDEGVVAENQPVQRSDVTREYEADNEGDKIQKGYTKNLLGQWKNKGNEEFKAQKREIILAEDEGVVAENQPVQRSDVTREYEADNEGDKIQKGYTKNLLGQWKNKGNEQFKAQKREIILAEDEGVVAENEPVQRSDVTREYEADLEGDKIQKGYTKNLLGQWKNKGNEEFQAPKKNIAWSENEGKISENQPLQRDDVVREFDMNMEGEQVQRGATKSLLGQWKNKGNEEFKAPKKEIILAEDEGKIAENEPVQRNDVTREYEADLEEDKIQKGYTKNLLGQWKNKGNEEFKAQKKDISWAEDEGRIAENQPLQRNDVVREYDADLEGEKIQKGYTKNLLGQWKNKGNEEFRAPRKEIVLAEDEGKIAENEPVQRADVTREFDANAEEEKIQKGYTKNLLGQWKNKGNEEFKAPKMDIAWAEDEGKIAENEPVQRSDVFREYDANIEGEKIQKGYTKNLLGQWKNKGNEEFKAQRKEIILAEDEGVVAENEPVQRSDVTREYEADLEGDKIQKGYTKNLLGQWKNKGNEEFKAQRREIILAEDEGVVSENQPVQRSDVTREYEADNEGDKIQKGYTKNLLGQWKNKGNAEFQAPKKDIAWTEEEGKISENQPLQRDDVVREFDMNMEGEQVQRGATKSLLGQWKNKGNEQFKAQKREIILAEDEGVVAENQPVQRSDVTREYEADNEGDKIQKGYTKNLLGQWKNKGNEEFQAPKKDIAWTEEEGKISENQPLQRDDVVREFDMNMEGEQVQRGATKSLLGQWKNKGSEEFKTPKKEIILAEDEGRIVENEPLRRDDVVREFDDNLEGEKIRRGTTRDLLGQWKDKGTQEFSLVRKEIVLAEDEGVVAENDPVQRSDVTRESDNDLRRELPQKGQAQNLKVQWMSSREQTPKERTPVNVMENEGEPSVVENDPVQRNDVVREGDNFEEVFLKRGFARDLAGYWQNGKEEEPMKEPFRLEMDVSTDENAVHENQPIELEGVVRYTDAQDEVMGKRGLIQMVSKQYLEPTDRSLPRSRDQINMDLADGPTILENEPIPVGPDVVRSDYNSIDDTSVTAGLTKNMLERWKYQSLDSSSPRTPSSLVDGKPAWVVEMEEAPGSGVFENQPEVRTDVTREVDYEPEMIPIKQTRNTRRMWSQMEQEDDDMAVDKDLVPELVRFTPPRELTPPPVHQEDFKSYQSITLSSGPNTTGPASPASQSQPGWSPSIVGPRHQTPQNHSSKKSTSSGPQQSKRGTAGAAYRVQSTSPSPQGVNAAYRKNQPTMGATYNPVQPETTMKSSAVLIFRPS